MEHAGHHEGSRRQWLWLLPFAAVFYYPWALAGFYRAGAAGANAAALGWIAVK